MKLVEKIAVVTGGGSGIGASICHAFAREGANVVVADINREQAQAVATSIQDAGGNATPVGVDVTLEEDIATMVRTTLAAHSRIDILVNNAGARTIKGFMQHTRADWDHMLNLNLSAPFACAQAVVPHMIAGGGGAIINLCSIASFVGRPNRCAYVAAKTGLLGLTRAMAIDMTGKNIRVNAIAPGMIASPFNQSFAEAEDTGDAWAQENVIGRWGQPDDISGAAVFLASDESGFVTGSEIKVEGGWLGTRPRSGELPMWD